SARRPLLLLCSVFALLAIVWGYASRLELHSDLRELLPRDSPGYAAFEHQLGRIGGGASLIVVVESPDRNANEHFIDLLSRRRADETVKTQECRARAKDERTAARECPELISYVEADTKELRSFYERNKWLYPSVAELEEAERQVDLAVAVKSGLVEDL